MHNCIPLTLYIHLPWCITKCPYCDFNSQTAPAQLIEITRQYFATLTQECIARKHLCYGRSIESIYFGGGTPNLIPAEIYQDFLCFIYNEIEISPNCEITLEANPGDGRIHDYTSYAHVGCNRLSIGVQSFHQQTLAKLGRDYTPTQLQHTLEKAFTSGINNINLDLLFAAPGQNHAMVMQDLTDAIAWQPTHISLYELTIEPNTIFYRTPPHDLPNEKTTTAMYQYLCPMLSLAGYDQYEVSAWSKPNYQCKHNCNYWQFGDYLALGAGAHAKITDSVHSQVLRYANQKNPTTYMQNITFLQPQVQPQHELLLQLCLNAFRLRYGMKISDAAHRICISQHSLLTQWQKWIDDGILCIKNERFSLSPHAYNNQNTLLTELL